MPLFFIPFMIHACPIFHHLRAHHLVINSPRSRFRHGSILQCQIQVHAYSLPPQTLIYYYDCTFTVAYSVLPQSTLFILFIFLHTSCCDATPISHILIFEVTSSWYDAFRYFCTHPISKYRSFHCTIASNNLHRLRYTQAYRKQLHHVFLLAPIRTIFRPLWSEILTERVYGLYNAHSTSGIEGASIFPSSLQVPSFSFSSSCGSQLRIRSKMDCCSSE